VGGVGGPAALRTAVDRGEIPASVDPSTRAKGLAATSQSLTVVGKANPDEEVLPAIVDNAFAGRPYISACRINGAPAWGRPRFFKSVSTLIQNLAPSPPDPDHSPRMSFSPARLTPSAA
jgi:hypothetical protein